MKTTTIILTVILTMVFGTASCEEIIKVEVKQATVKNLKKRR